MHPFEQKGLPFDAIGLKQSVLRRIRFIRGHRSLSFEAATILAHLSSLDILADMTAQMHNRIRICWQRSDKKQDVAVICIKLQEHQNTFQRWHGSVKSVMRTNALLKPNQNIRYYFYSADLGIFWIRRRMN